jgi:hypothetical protein
MFSVNQFEIELIGKYKISSDNLRAVFLIKIFLLEIDVPFDEKKKKMRYKIRDVFFYEKEINCLAFVNF